MNQTSLRDILYATVGELVHMSRVLVHFNFQVNCSFKCLHIFMFVKHNMERQYSNKFYFCFPISVVCDQCCSVCPFLVLCETDQSCGKNQQGTCFSFIMAYLP